MLLIYKTFNSNCKNCTFAYTSFKHLLNQHEKECKAEENQINLSLINRKKNVKLQTREVRTK